MTSVNGPNVRPGLGHPGTGSGGADAAVSADGRTERRRENITVYTIGLFQGLRLHRSSELPRCSPP